MSSLKQGWGRRQLNLRIVLLSSIVTSSIVPSHKYVPVEATSFFKCVPNTRNLEALSPLMLTSPLMLKRVGVARTYIRPLQRDTTLPTDEV